MFRKFRRELSGLGLPAAPGPEINLARIGETELDPLPETVRRYLRFMRVVGKPRDWSFRLGFTGCVSGSNAGLWRQPVRPGGSRLVELPVALVVETLDK